MATSTGSGSPSLDTINNIFGTSLEFPKCFRKPGTASNFELKSGYGHIGFDGAAATFNPNPLGGAISQMTNGIDQVNGIQNVVGALTVTGQSLFIGGVKGETAYWSLNTGSYNVTAGGSISLTAGKNMELAVAKNLDIGAAANLSINCPTLLINGLSWEGYVVEKLSIAGKGFDIPHPSKKKHRLRYICLEGPEIGAYVRGTLKETDVIELPDYWKDLVYPESITVNLTAVGHYQELYVEKIENGTQIKVKNNAGSSIHCYYTVFAERITKDKLQPEYKGLTPADYPGDNSEYVLAGWDYGKDKSSIL